MKLIIFLYKLFTNNELFVYVFKVFTDDDEDSENLISDEEDDKESGFLSQI